MSDSVDKSPGPGVLAIDVGSSRLKFGWFPDSTACGEKPEIQLPIAAPQLPEPAIAFAIDHGLKLEGDVREAISDWLKEQVPGGPITVLASVRPGVADVVQKLLSELDCPVTRRLSNEDLPLDVEVDFPERVGIDRLLDAVGANRLRETGRPAIVVDLGTAGTVDLISSEGAFLGGAIMPGMSLSARALHGATASLPELSPEDSEDGIAVVGKNTEAAIAAGLFWGTVGALNELIARTAEQVDGVPHLFVTGGGAASVIRYLKAPDGSARLLPHLVLSSISLVAEESK